ncbi:MAG: methyltransferase domain-containing protein [Planctomycetota bacterium]
METEQNALYGRRAEYYDYLYDFKPYDEEAARLHEILAGLGIKDDARVLEAACGTGAYLVHLKNWYQVSGLDLSPELLEIAKKKLPEVSLMQADMADFTVEKPYDALLCLFSSIGYVYPEKKLRKAAHCFAQAVRPGGVLVVEPWLTREKIIPDHIAMQTYDGKDLKLCRSVIPRIEGDLLVFDFHWLAVERGAPDVEYTVERHKLWLCPTQTLLAAFEEAGFESRFEPDGFLPDRGLIIGKRRDR